MNEKANNGDFESARSSLRRRAEAVARERGSPALENPDMITAEARKVVFHELRVHQIELELTNDELRRIQSELGTSHARYLELYDQAPVGYLTIAESGMIIEANRTAAGILSVGKGVLVLQLLTRFILPDDRDLYHFLVKNLFRAHSADLTPRLAREMADVAAHPDVPGDACGGQPDAAQECELRMLKGDDTVFVGHLVATAAIGDNGTPVCHIVLSDITERKRSEEREKDLRAKLERAARMDALGVLAGGAAHQMNNALGPLLGLPDMVAEYIERYGDPADPEHAEALRSIQAMKNSAQRAVGIVNDLVVMGRRGQFQKTPVDVNRLVDEMMASQRCRDLQELRPGVRIVTKLTAEPIWCLGAGARLVRVLTDLAVNAVEAIAGHGSVVISTGRQVLTDSYNGYEVVPAGTYVTMEVTDTGCGMDADMLGRIFEPFFSTKAMSCHNGNGKCNGKASGLGLSVVYGLVKDHSGFLDVKSVLGSGTTVKVYLPAVDVETVKVVSEAEPVVGGHERVLVVDDEEDQLFLSRRQLKKLGYDPTLASSGEEAVGLFEAARKSGNASPFDLVLMDMIMPGGMDGMSTCKEILGLFPGQKILILSGHAPEKYAKQVSELGIGWLPKPCLSAELARALRTALDR